MDCSSRYPCGLEFIVQLDLLSVLVGVGIGWIVQWFFIDWPILRREASKPINLLPDPDVVTGPKVGLGSTGGDELVRHELEETHAALASANAEIERLRMWSLDERDDLTQIKGLGPVSERKLIDAGITTFKQLADLSPDEVITIVRSGPWPVVTPGTWIEQAKNMSLH